MIKITNLTKYYDRKKPVIDKMNLEFGDAGLNIVVGKSGCGKTTLLNLLGTMDYDYTGTIEVNGKVLSKMNYNEVCHYKNYVSGFIFQKDSLFEELSVKENLQIILDLQGESTNISEVLEKVGLKGFEDKKVKYLSGGEKQRVSIARVLAKKSEVIFADEPTSALDSKNAHRIFKLLHEISKEKLVIIVTHDTKKAFQYADRIIYLHDGQVKNDEVINNRESKLKKEIEKKPKRLALSPLFRYQFTKGFIVNTFVVILLSLVVMLMIISAEQQIVKAEYDAVKAEYGPVYSDEDDEILGENQEELEELLTTGERIQNTMRFLKTLVANNINLYSISKVDTEESAFEYLEKISQAQSNLTYLEFESLRKTFASSNTYQSLVAPDKLYIRGLSNQNTYEIPFTSAPDGLTHYYYSLDPTDYSYYQYNENNHYNLLFGRMPENNNEIIITDTIADKYLRSNKLYQDNLNTIIGMNLEIAERLYSINDNDEAYYYRDYNPETNELLVVPVNYVNKYYTVVGVIETGYLDYYQYSTVTDTYDFSVPIQEPFNFTTLRDVEYMNHNYNKPYGYVIFMDYLTASKEIPNYYDSHEFSDIMCDGFTLDKKSVSTFHGYLDYKNMDSYIDDLDIDYNNRILVKDVQGNTLEENQILATASLIYTLYPQYRSSNDIIAHFDEINGDKLDVTISKNGKEITLLLEIVGVARNEEDISFYLSDEMLQEVYQATQMEDKYQFIVDLDGYDASKRYDLMLELYQKGFILSPINLLPGAYMEFVEGAGKMIGTDDEGVEETINISLYHLFSSYYTTDEMLGANNFLDIIDNICVFSLIMGLLISIGFIYLKERKQKNMVIKLSAVGVKAKTIVLMQLVSFVMMAILVFCLTYIFSNVFVNYINNTFTINFSETVNIYRYRLLLTDIAWKYAAVAGLVTFSIGAVSTIIVVYQHKK